MKLVALLSIASLAAAQVTIKFTPEPMAVTAAQLKAADALGRWQIQGCLEGAPRSLAFEQISQAAPNISLIDWADAVLYLTGAQRKSTAAKVVNALAVISGLGATAAQVTSVVGGTVRTGNARIAAGLAVGSLVLQLLPVVIPAITGTAQSQVPQISPLISPVKYPILLDPSVNNGCYTDHVYAAKMPKPQPFVVKVP